MTKFNKIRAAIAIVTVPMFLVFIAPSSTFAAGPVIHQGSTSTYAVLAYSTITNTGATTMSGTAGADIGLSPGTAFTNTGTVTTSGSQHITDAAAATAQNPDFVTAYNDLGTPTATTLTNPDLASQVILPGTYNTAAGTFANSGNLTLDGNNDPNAIFIFQAASTVITSTGSTMILQNGAQACNVYWRVGSSATLGVNSSFIGHVYAQVSVTANTGASIKGQLLAHTGAVTLDGNTIVNNNCTSTTPTPTPSPCTASISNLHYTTGGAGTTNGKLTWTTSGPGLFQYIGNSTLYPTPYVYGGFTSTWDGSLTNVVPGTSYPVSVKFIASCGTISQASTTALNDVAAPTPTPTPTVTPTPVVTPTPTPTPVITPTPTPTPVVTPAPKPTKVPTKTVTGGKLPKTGSPWYNLLALSAGLILLGGCGTYSRKLKRN